MKFKTILILSILIIFISVNMVSASENITQDDSAVNTRDVVSVKGSSFEDIQKAINSSSENNVLELDGYFSGTRNRISIDKDLTLEGLNGTTLDGKKLSGFDISSNVILKNLIIKNCGEHAISFTPEIDKNLTIINCTFYHNGGLEGYSGGAVYMNMGSFTIINSTFKANNAYSGSSIFFSQGYLSSDRPSEIINCTFINHNGNSVVDALGNLNVKNSVFENNTCTAIWSQDNLNISKSRFIRNTGKYGGAIFKYSMGENMTISDCVFDENSAEFNGGSIYSVSNLFDDTIQCTITILNSSIAHSDAGENGSAIYVTFTNLFMNDSSIMGEIYQDIGEFENVNSTCDSIKRIVKHNATLIAEDLITTYDSYDLLKVYFLEGCHVNIRVYTGNTFKDHIRTVYDDDDGMYACLWIDDNFTVGKHRVVISCPNIYYNTKNITVYMTVNKAKTIVKAPKVTAKYKKSKAFKVTVTNKASYERVGKIKIKIKVYTGKKYKIYKVKTNKKGVASINTKKLKRGTYKVKITSLNSNYIISKTSKIIIK